MDRQAVLEWVQRQYGTLPDDPWARYPHYCGLGIRMALVRFALPTSRAGTNRSRLNRPWKQTVRLHCVLYSRITGKHPRLWRGERSHVRGLDQLDAGEPGK